MYIFMKTLTGNFQTGHLVTCLLVPLYMLKGSIKIPLHPPLKKGAKKVLLFYQRGGSGDFAVINRHCNVAGLCLAFLFCLVLSSCNPASDKEQVQVVTSASAFKPFTNTSRNIACGPSSLKASADSAIIAWEEKLWTGDLRHVEVSIAGLSPATQYFYRVNGAAKDGRFVTAPEDDSPFSFFIVGDTQTDPDVSRQIAGRMLDADPSAAFALHMGDLVGTSTELEYWESQWWEPMADFMLYLPVYPTVGNHDAGSSFYLRYFGALGDNSTSYSFDWGAVHFIMLDVSGAIDESGEAVAWLKKDLEEHQSADFIVVCHHLPPYLSTAADEGGAATERQEILAPIYERYGVDLVLSGDMHGYQHHFKNNIHYVISAGGGGRLYDYGLPLEGVTLQLYKAHNFSVCRVEDKSLHIVTYAIDGKALDDFKITQGEPEVVKTYVAAEADRSEVAPGESFRVDLYLVNGTGIDNASFTLSFYKDDPPVKLAVSDADDEMPGIQIEQGDLGGEVAVNQADSSTGIITYKEKKPAGLTDSKTRIASAYFTAPADARVTAFYLVPHCSFTDAAGRDIPHFMGGLKVAVKKK